MDTKTRNRVMNLLGGVVGAIIGYFYPMFFQNFLPVLGIGVGLFYFFASNSVNKDPNKKKVTDFTEFTWYMVLRTLLGFLVGGAIVSTIILTADIFEQQKQNSYILDLLSFI